MEADPPVQRVNFAGRITIDDQTTEVAMFAALKLGDMIREAIANYEALAKQDGQKKAEGAEDE